MAAGRRQIPLPNQGIPWELGLWPDLSANPVAATLPVIDLETKSLDWKAGLPLPPAPQGLGKLASSQPQTGLKQAETAALLEVEGELEDGDEVLPDGSLYDLHTFEGEAGQFVEIRLDSDDFDAYLILVGPEGERVAEDDDGGEGFNALISIQLPKTGRYSVIANAYDASGRGRYRLTVVAIRAEEYQREQERASANAEADQLLQQGIEQFNRSQFREALASWERALELYRAAGNRAEEGRALGNLGNVYNSLGQYERAIAFHEQHLAILREIGDRAGEGRALGNLGIVYDNLGQYERAIDFYEQSLAITREIGDRAGEGRALGNLGIVYDNLGQYERAIDFYEQSLAINREIGDRAGEGRALGNLGNVYNSLGQYERAIDFYEQYLAIAREIGNRAGEGNSLGGLGNVYDNLGQYERAIDFYEQYLAIAREIGDRAGEGNSLGGLGNVYNSLGEYERAIDFYEQYLAIAREIGDRAGEGGALGNLGIVYDNLGQYERAIDFYEQHLEIAREIGDRAGEGRALNNLGVAYRSLGQYERAIDFYEQSLVIAREIGDRAGEGSALGNLGIVYDNLGQYERAIDFSEQYLAIAREIGDRAGEGSALGNLGNVYNSLGQYERAIDFYEQRLAIAREIGDHGGEGIALGNLGSAYFSLGQYELALEQYCQAVALFNELGARAEEATVLSNIGRPLNRQGQPELAITFLKASVDILEAIRGDIRQLDTDLQQSFTDTVADDYRRLADLLLQQDRVLEAQEVLDLLKLQELEDYQIRNVRGTEETRQGLSFWQPEREIIDRFYSHLETHTDPQTFFTSTAITERVAQLQRNARSQNPNPEQLARLQGNLQQAGNAALLYPLVLDDRLELVLVTTTGISRHTVSVDRVQLNRVIAAFRSDILDPFSHPHPNAQQLYQWLIAPLTQEIDRAGAETILYAADGQLRYIPLAALHDGDQWLTQRYTVNHITAASLMDFSQSQAAPLSILAGAFPAEDLAVEVAGVQRYFNGLPYAQVEVENLEANLPGTVAFFSAGFNRQAIEPRLGDHTIIHLATHGTFQSGHPNDSFILLGDGDRITLFDLDQWELPNAALVVLSACETAVSGPELGTGVEILGFGYQIQRTGARAAIASLWVVSDGGTQVLMNGFYGAMQLGLPKAEALREAQMALITGDYTAVGGRRGDIEIRGGQRQNPMGDPLAHPYYWAPFILIGNGL